MREPSKRFLTIILALGILALLAGITLGEHEGDFVMGQVTQKRLSSIAPVTVTPAPRQTASAYGPNWKRSDVISVATDPAFPDPRVPPVPLPTPLPQQKSAPSPAVQPAPSPTATPNLNLPVWRRNAPLPTPTAQQTPLPGPSLQPNGEPVGEPSSRP